MVIFSSFTATPPGAKDFRSGEVNVSDYSGKVKYSQSIDECALTLDCGNKGLSCGDFLISRGVGKGHKDSGG